MQSWKLLPLVILSGCASQPSIDAIHAQTKARVYPYQVTTPKNEYMVVPAGSYQQGNCTTFAATAYTIFKENGYSPELKVCQLPSGIYHAYVEVDGMISDQMHRYPIRKEDFNCRELIGWRNTYVK